LLVQLLQPDARPPAPGSIVQVFEPVVHYSPIDLHAALALGLAQTRTGKIEQGIALLRGVCQAHAERPEAWDCLLTALDESGQVDDMQEELEHVPAVLGASPRLLKHRARVAQGSARWTEAIDLYRRARMAEPYNRVVEYRLSRALRHIGATAAADIIETRVRRRDVAIQEIRPLYDQVTAAPSLGTSPHIQLYQRIADVRERMQLPEEARAWHTQVLRHGPNNAVSLAALKRLRDENHPAD
jgi:tetratricopeptide (TPR) repeat protein